VTVKIYVEGGGDHNKALATQCRYGFSEFLKRAGLKGRMPRIVACGGRRRAYESFRTSHEGAGPNDHPMLLVDSEAPVTATPWDHVRLREGDGWERPSNASDEQLHFMVQTMEAWFYADKNELQRYYGQGFRPSVLGARADIDNISKADLFAGLQAATKDCQKGEYSKGQHSFQILARIDPEKVRNASPQHGERFLAVLDRICS
jgi:hypothetical protein